MGRFKDLLRTQLKTCVREGIIESAAPMKITALAVGYAETYFDDEDVPFYEVMKVINDVVKDISDMYMAHDEELFFDDEEGE